MADESILDQAIALIPGLGEKKKRAKPASPEKRLSDVQKKLAKLTKELDRVAGLIARTSSKAKGSAKGRARGSTRMTTKRPKPGARAKPSAGARSSKAD